MFKCTHCDRTFSRKDSLLRHMKRQVHTRSNGQEYQTNNNDQVGSNQFEYTTNQSVNNETNLNNPESGKYSVQSESLNSNDEDNDSENDYSFERKNSTQEEDISSAFQNIREDHNVDRSEGNVNPFNRSMIAAVEAIKTKFNCLRNSRNRLKSVNSEDHRSNEQKLDILMIKELQNSSEKVEGEEDGNSIKHTERKRSSTSNSLNGERNEDTEVKRLKTEIDVLDNGHLECIERRCERDPNILVDKLRNLMTRTQKGREMFKIIQKLMEGSGVKTFTDDMENKKQRNELINNLNKLKENDIGQEILSIIRKLEEAEIIEPVLSNILNGDIDDDENISADDSDDTVSEESYDDVGESTAGKGLYLQPYRRR